ncbi:ABC transporter ATP-binding protein/permease [Pseudomonas cavernicola]|uniref:ABC transporter ATP-binding protein/permease n=1 Tax=Pseudomonas cavernicola TaxID=2320866 RepID=A0A418XLF0_9PSED|nr:ABC transporter ATP-binding protein/permease [Pseudomonas cavernicola]RJG13309.1 ABC transporter ATP-binding protein/permease [Pseudomonas cavernicola]
MAGPAELRQPPRPRWLFLRLVVPYWNSAGKWKVRGFILALLLLTLAQVSLVIWMNYWSRALFDALEDRSLSRFLLQLGTFAVILLLTIGVTALHMQAKRWLQLDWRRWLTAKVLDRWMAHGHHYQLQLTEGEHDNPDGRIAEDIRVVTESAIALTHSLVYSLLIFGSFVDILLAVTGSAHLPGTSLLVPGYMVILAFAYAGAGTLFGMLLGRPLINATNKLQTAEANFRFGLAHSRECSESIALMRGEGVERQNSTAYFAELGRRWYRQTLGYLGIVSFSSGYGVLLPVFPILVVAPQYIAGSMTLGVLMQSAQAFQQVTSALSWPIDNLAELARCRASADRVMSLYNDLLRLEEQVAKPQEHRINLVQSNRAELVLRDLCIANPDGQILIEGLNTVIQRGERVLIAGDPAVTTSLFKVLAGLWPWGHGKVWLPAGQAISFLPQRPFLPFSSLQSVLSYPLPADTFAASAMQQALECAGIAWLASRLGEVDNWDRVLPLRVQQRLGIARLFLQQPAWVFIEEATNAFDPKGEESMMDMLHRELPSATLLAISFHTGLEPYYQRKLLLNRLPQEKFLSSSAPVYALRET